MKQTISTQSHTRSVRNSLAGFLGVFAFLALFISSVAYANTPTLSLVPTGDGNSVQLSVYGDANSSVILYYVQQGTGSQIAVLGNTNSGGSFSTIINSATYGIVSNSLVHVSTGSVSGPSSATTTWPTVTTGGNGTLSLSQTNVTLSVGQSTIVTANNTTYGSIYVSNNSNPSVASISANGTQITVTGITYGSTSVTVCSGSSSYCSTLYITVQNNGTQSLTFSQSNVSIPLGQTVSVAVTGGSGSYYISSNTNPNSVQATINGSTIVLSSLYSSSQIGSSTVTVCSNNTTSCGTIYVTTGSTNSSSVTFNQYNPTLSTGQSTTIGISGGLNSSYYVSLNSNPSVVEASVVGSTLSLTGVTTGSSTLTVCSSGGTSCGTLTVTIGYGSTGSLTLSQQNITLTQNQTSSVAISGSGSYYISSNTNQSIASASISGSSVVIYALSAGNTTITVCQSSGQCATMYVYVTGTTTTNNVVGSSFLTFSNPSPVVLPGQSMVVYVTGGQGGGYYTIPYNSNSNIVQTTISGTTLTLTGVQNGYAVVVVCDGYNNCGPLYARVGTGLTIPVITPPVITTPTVFIFTAHIALGSYGTEVGQLQTRLTALGLYTGPIDNSFGTSTRDAVIRFQGLHGLTPDGNVGPLTRAALNNS